MMKLDKGMFLLTLLLATPVFAKADAEAERHRQHAMCKLATAP